MLDERAIIIASVVHVLLGLGYLKSTLQGKTKPNKVTWALWAIVPMIVFAAQLQQGVGLVAIRSFLAGFVPALIFFGSFLNKNAQWKIVKLDVVCGALSLLGIILWQITDIPNLAILLAIIADGFATIPTITKSWSFPQTENTLAFWGGALSSGVALLTLDSWNFANSAFFLYLLAACLLLILLIQFKLGTKFQKQQA